MNETLDNNINSMMENLGVQNITIKRKFFIGKQNPIKAALIFIKGIVNKDTLDRDVLNPLMNYVNEDLKNISNLPEHILEMYIPMANTFIEKDINKAIDYVKNGKTALLIEGYNEILIIDTADGKKVRAISEPENESVLRGARAGFIEDINVNISLIKSRIKDSSLTIEFLKIGRRSQTDVALIFIKDIADNNIVEQLKNKISQIDIDCITATGELEQYIVRENYNIFPRFNGTERIDKIESGIMEGRVAVILDGTPYVLTVPSIFSEFFQAPEDYYQNTISSSFIRLLRYFAAFVVIMLGPFYLTLVKANNEFIPL